MRMKKNELGKRIVLTTIACAVLLLLSDGTARADELSELQQQMKNAMKSLQQMQKRMAELEAREKLKEKSQNRKIAQEVEKKVEEKVAEAVKDKQSAALPDSLKWAEKVKISGDLRYRQDHKDEEDSGRPGRWKDGVYRHRPRARLLFEAIVNGDWDVAFRIASGSDRSPISTNQDLEDGFSKKHIWLDLAFFNWHPACMKDLNVYGGKIKNPFYKAGKNQLIWDGDLNPEGVAAKYSKALNATDRLYINAGGFWVDEITSAADISLWAAQTYVKRKIGVSKHVLAGATYYDYTNLKGKADLKSTWGASNFFGNTATAGMYKEDYDIVEIFGEYGFNCCTRPTTLFSSWVRNLAAATSEDTGWLVGVKFNKAKDDAPGSWECAYDYRETDADAVIGGFCESDFLGAKTNSRGHRGVFKYQLARNLYWIMTYYLLEDTSTSVNLKYRRLLADLVWKF